MIHPQRALAAGRSIELDRIRPGISEGDELAERARRGRQPSLALPGKADVHGVNIVVQGLEIDAMSFERPRPIDHIGENGDAHPGCHHAADSFHRQRAEDDVGDVRRLLPVAHRRTFGLDDRQHQKRLADQIGQPNAVLVQQRVIGAGP